MITRRTIKDQFTVCTDSGKEYEIMEYQEWIDSSDSANPNEETPGLCELVCSDGGHVNFLNEDTYLIVRTQEKARRVD